MCVPTCLFYISTHERLRFNGQTQHPCGHSGQLVLWAHMCVFCVYEGLAARRWVLCMLGVWSWCWPSVTGWAPCWSCGPESIQVIVKESQPVHPKGDQPWVFIGGTDVEAETPIVWPPDVKNWLIWKDPDAGKDWRQEEKTTDDKMVGWHHWLDGNEFEQALGVGDGQGRLACCSPWGQKELDMTEPLSWTDSDHPCLLSVFFQTDRGKVKVLPWVFLWGLIVFSLK